MKINTTKKIALAACAAVGITTPAFATIIAVVPDIVLIAAPPDVTLGALESDVDLHAFDERQCFQVPAGGLDTDQGQIPAGVWVSSHFVHGDAVAQLLLDGGVRFDHDILGVISTTAGLDASDALCGAGGTFYPPPGTEAFRGLESTQADGYTLVDPRTLRVRMEVPLDSYSDQLRAITRCCPDGQVCD